MQLRILLKSLFIILLIFPCVSWAQPSVQNKAFKTTIKGTLINSSTGESLPFATVAVYSVADSSMVSNALTEADGSFSLTVGPGSYYAQARYIGFEEKTIQDIDVKGKRETIDLGEIMMKTDAVALQEVEVRAERSQMELKLDRRVFNVGKDLANAGNNAADILDRVPSVTVDPEGNVSLRGSQSVRILVNGKPSGLLSAGDAQALLRMQGDIIESVEVITNPSARYEAEGEAGIINIILKKNQEKGVNGSFGATVGQPDNFGASYNLNYRKSNFNFFSNFGINYRKTPGGGNSTQRFFDDGNLTNFFTSEEDQLRGGTNLYFQGGADWTITDKDILTGSMIYRIGKENNNGTLIYSDFDENSNLISRTTREIEEDETDNDIEASLDYRKLFDKENQELTITAKYILNDDTEEADYFQTATDVQDPLIQRSRNTEDESNLLFQADYVHPLGEDSKIEAGLRAALRVVNNDFFVEEEEASGEYFRLSGFDDELKYTEDIYAAYFIAAKEFGPVGVQAGLRAEYSDITAALLRSNNSNDQNYLSFFPSIAISYQVSEEDQIQMSYSRRLSRPYFRDLLPFSNFNDPRNNGVGNPNLRPEFTDSYEAGYLHYFSNGSLLSSAYYRRTTGVIEDITIPASDGTAIDFPVNLAERDAFGFEFSFSYDLAKWWDLTSDLNFYRGIVSGEFEGTSLDADFYTWTGGLISKFTLSSAFKFQASFDYNAPRNTTQGRRLSSYSLDLAASLDIFGGNGTITLTGRDLFNTRQRRSIVDLPNYKSESTFQWRQTRQVVLALNYRLNQEKKDKDLLGGE